MFVTTITTFPLFGDYPTRGEVWTARAILVAASGGWAAAASSWPGFGVGQRVLSCGAAALLCGVAWWLVDNA